jgi:hypothetical protein
MGIAMTERWEYRIQSITADDLGARTLSELGAQGWRVIETFPGATTPSKQAHLGEVSVLLERPAQTPSA